MAAILTAHQAAEFLTSAVDKQREGERCCAVKFANSAAIIASATLEGHVAIIRAPLEANEACETEHYDSLVKFAAAYNVD